MADQWNAMDAGRDLLAAVTVAIAGERAAAATRGALASDAMLARAVLASPAIVESCRATMDALEGEYKPRIATLVAAEAGKLIGTAIPGVRAGVAEEIASAIEADICTPGADCGDMGCRQALRDAATARRIGGAP